MRILKRSAANHRRCCLQGLIDRTAAQRYGLQQIRHGIYGELAAQSAQVRGSDFLQAPRGLRAIQLTSPV